MTAQRPVPGRPYHFLVSTTSHANSLRQTLGAPAYSYAFVYEALLPTLRALGQVTLVDRPESRLSWLALEASQSGQIPIHLSINPLQNAYLVADIPNIVFPFWEFPHVPDRAFGHDTRQNWTRVVKHADMILAACRFTADALLTHSDLVPVKVVPVPLPRWIERVNTWHNGATIVRCKHVFLDDHLVGPESSRPDVAAAKSQSGLRTTLRASFQKVAPLLGQKWMERIARSRQACRGRSPGGAALTIMRHLYKRVTRAWLSDAAIDVLSQRGRALAARVGLARDAIDPEIPVSDLVLGGLVYSSFLSMGDPRKNPGDLLTAYLLACRERADATLVIKLASNQSNAAHELARLQMLYGGLGIRHRCRVVAIVDYLDDDQLVNLLQATAFYVNTSHAEGACLPLMQALAAGRPAIAPAHTAMADYIDADSAFVVGSDAEPCAWPHDPEQRLETEWQRLRWSDIFDGFVASQNTFDSPRAYGLMAERARIRMRAYSSHENSHLALAQALNRLVGGQSVARVLARRA